MKNLSKALDYLKSIEEPHSIDGIISVMKDITNSVYKLNIEAIVFLSLNKKNINIWYKNSIIDDDFILSISESTIKTKSSILVKDKYSIPLHARSNYFGSLIVYDEKQLSNSNKINEIKDGLSILVDYFALLLYSEKLSFQANTDRLTKIYNRGYIFNYINNIYIKNKAYSIIMFDVDKFKHYNDRYGHTVGDYILKKLTYIIKMILEKSYKFARYGGEEFIIVLPTDEKDIIIKTMENIRNTVSKSNFSTDEYSLKVTVSIGASVGREGKDPYQTIDEADKALYMAKESGRNKAIFYDRLS